MTDNAAHEIDAAVACLLCSEKMRLIERTFDGAPDPWWKCSCREVRATGLDDLAPGVCEVVGLVRTPAR